MRLEVMKKNMDSGKVVDANMADKHIRDVVHQQKDHNEVHYKGNVSKSAFLKGDFQLSGDNDLMTSKQQRRENIKRLKKNTKEREKETLSRLMSFKTKLRETKPKANSTGHPKIADRVGRFNDEQFPAAWRVDGYIDERDEEDEEGDWKCHKLSFKDSKSVFQDPMSHHDNVDDYIVYDPLLENHKKEFYRKSKRGRSE